jgi:hypothetical protein
MLIRLCQTTNFGSIRGMDIREGEPVFEPGPTLVVDLKLEAGDPPRPELGLRDFHLAEEVVRLMEQLDHLATATIDCIEIRAGLPRRVVFKAPSQSILAALPEET